MEQLVSTFHIDWKIIIAQAVNFGIVFFVLYRFAIKPLAKMMQERGDKIEQGLKDAKQNSELLVNTEKDYQEKLAEARKEGANLIASMKKEVEKERGLLMDKAHAEVAQTLKAGKEALEAEKSKLMESARKEIAELVIATTEKVLSKGITPDIDKKIIETSIGELK